jgi:hypothetical protein
MVRFDVRKAGAVAAVACCAALGAAGTAVAGTTAGAARTAVVWGAPHPIPWKAGPAGTSVAPDELSCAGPGDCAATGGTGGAAGFSQVFVADEKAGVWRKAALLAGLKALSQGTVAEPEAISCPSPGNCVTGGLYAAGSSSNMYAQQGYLAAERNGVWGKAVDVPGLKALNKGFHAAVTSISCPAPGNCAAGGYYQITDPHFGPSRSSAYVMDEVRGKWGTARQVPGIAALAVVSPDGTSFAGVTMVSCGSAGNCAAVGFYQDSAGNSHAFVVDEVHGTWRSAKPVPGMPDATAVSCAAPGNCAAAGVNFVVDEKHGAWGPARQIPGTTVVITAISCGSPGNCAAGGFSQAAPTGPQHALLVDERNGAWGAPRTVAGALNAGGMAAVSSVACRAAGACYAGGYYTDGHSVRRGFVAAQARGTWGKALEIAKGAVGPISCFSPVSCGALVEVAPFGTFGIDYYADVMNTSVRTVG